MISEIFTELVGKLRSREDAKRLSAEDRYQTIVRQAADGAKLKIDDVEAVLAETGRTSDDLQADVELIQKRRAWAKELESEPALTARRDALQAEREAANEKLRKLREATAARDLEIAAELTIVCGAINSLENARVKLRETAPKSREAARIQQKTGPVAREVESLQHERKTLSAQLTAQERELRAVEARKPESQFSQQGYREQVASLQESIAGTRAKLSRIDQRLPAAQREVEASNKRVRELDAAALTA